jgi:hypothetical protein
MALEMEALDKNNTWELVSLLIYLVSGSIVVKPAQPVET